jgi:hypothetical protein
VVSFAVAANDVGPIDQVSNPRYSDVMTYHTRRILVMLLMVTIATPGCLRKTCDGWGETMKQSNAFAHLADNESNEWQISGRIDLPVVNQVK